MFYALKSCFLVFSNALIPRILSFFCQVKSSRLVFICLRFVVYFFTLQTNIEQNNNKFFAIQLIEDNDDQKYSVWFRWGRVGFKVS